MSEIEPPHDTVAESLDAAHRDVGLRHDASRARLLDCLPTECDPPAPRPRLVLGGVGAGVAIATILLVWAGLPGPSASAMERVAKAMGRVNSFTYRMEETFVSTQGEGRTVESIYEGKWRREPMALWGTMKLWSTPATATEKPGPRRQIVDIEESHRDGERGVLIDHLKRQSWRVPPIDAANNLRGGTPVAIVSKIQDRRWRVVRELGSKRLGGREARGLLIRLDSSQPAVDRPDDWKDMDKMADGEAWTDTEVELWYDPRSDLPIEFVNTRSGDGFKTITRYSGFNWNAKFEQGTFAPIAPEDYEVLEQSPFANAE